MFVNRWLSLIYLFLHFRIIYIYIYIYIYITTPPTCSSWSITTAVVVKICHRHSPKFVLTRNYMVNTMGWNERSDPTCALRTSVTYTVKGSIDGFIGPKVTSGLCLYIGLLVAPATNTVKVMSNEVGIRLLCYGMCFTYIHTFICGDPPQYQNFSKRLCWINMST